ncbi:MAG: ArsR/SmtB family transcription factor [Candidatus Rokuibacteriota bacterium]
MATAGAAPVPHEELLDSVFFALSDPVRRTILARLGKGGLLVSEVAAPFDISLQAVSRHVQVLVQAGLVQQERTGRIARCRLEVKPMFAAAAWIDGYRQFWQGQLDSLGAWLEQLPRPSRGRPGKRPRGSRRGTRWAGASRRNH